MVRRQRNTAKSSSDRRKHARIELRRVLSVRVQDRELPLITANFGFGGVFLETEAPLPVDAILKILLEQDGVSGETLARVVRQDGKGMAVAFVEPPEEFTTLLITLVAPYLEREA